MIWEFPSEKTHKRFTNKHQKFIFIITDLPEIYLNYFESEFRKRKKLETHVSIKKIHDCVCNLFSRYLCIEKDRMSHWISHQQTDYAMMIGDKLINYFERGSVCFYVYFSLSSKTLFFVCDSLAVKWKCRWFQSIHTAECDHM
jgi:hypothetical protein